MLIVLFFLSLLSIVNCSELSNQDSSNLCNSSGSGDTSTAHLDSANIADPSLVSEIGDAIIDKLRKWVLVNGGVIEGLEIRKDEASGLRGMFATNEIQKDNIILQLPFKLIITDVMGRDTDIGKKLNASKEMLSDTLPYSYVAIFMLTDMAKVDSFYKPFYDSLPTKLEHLPIFWSKDELKYLEGSPILDLISKLRYDLRNQYKLTCQIVPSFKAITWKSFLWAYMSITSRSVWLVMNKKRVPGMVPFADLSSYETTTTTNQGPKLSWAFDENLQQLSIKTKAVIKEGEPIYLRQGASSNLASLLGYGFVVESADQSMESFDHSIFRMTLKIDIRDHLYGLKLLILRKAVPLQYYELDRDLKGTVRAGSDKLVDIIRLVLSTKALVGMKSLFAIIRVIYASEEEITGILGQLMSLDPMTIGHLVNMKKPDDPQNQPILDAMLLQGRELNPVDIESERKMLQWLRSYCEAMLAKYPTTLEADLEQLSSATTFIDFPSMSNQRNAMVLVRGEKEILHFYRDFAELALRLLDTEDSSEFTSKYNAAVTSHIPMVTELLKVTVVPLKTTPRPVESLDSFTKRLKKEGSNFKLAK